MRLKIKDKSILIKVSPAEKQMIKAVADQNGKTMSRLILDLVRQAQQQIQQTRN